MRLFLNVKIKGIEIKIECDEERIFKQEIDHNKGLTKCERSERT